MEKQSCFELTLEQKIYFHGLDTFEGMPENNEEFLYSIKETSRHRLMKLIVE